MLSTEWESKWGNWHSAPASITICVCSSVPVVIFPRARIAPTITLKKKYDYIKTCLKFKI